MISRQKLLETIFQYEFSILCHFGKNEWKNRLSVNCSIPTKKLHNIKLREMAIFAKLLGKIEIGYLWNIKFHSKYINPWTTHYSALLARLFCFNHIQPNFPTIKVWIAPMQCCICCDTDEALYFINPISWRHKWNHQV